MAASKDQYFSKSLEKGLRVLSLFNETNPVHSQSEIARALNLNMTSTYRFINTLVELGYLRRSGESKKIKLGFRSMTLAATVLRTIDFHKAVKSLVDDFHSRHGMTIDVALVADGAMMIVYRREAEETLTYRLPSVSRAWHTTSLGKAYLAYIDEADLEENLRNISLEKRTPNSIVDVERLLREIAETRQRGFAVADQEFLPGLITIGAPLIDPGLGRAVGSVSFDFSTIQQDVGTMIEQYSGLLLDLSRNISKMINMT